MGYPVYPQMMPNYGGMVMPGQMIPMPSNIPMGSVQSSYNSSDISNLSNQINNLEQRVSRLESMINKGSYSNYNSSNYQMMWPKKNYQTIILFIIF